jgi:nitroimidazol reductase NimA-like FMN-containing flavoprotein (pyridoxamine 5'-phosphate oxidase superfamily)
VTIKRPAPPSTARVRVRRFRERGFYGRQTVYRILDAGMLCQIGFLFEGTPIVVPTLYWRTGAHVYFHGSNGSRMLRSIEGNDICFSATHLDGIVLTRSAFHHSVNYRSVSVFGRAMRIEPKDKIVHLRHLMDRLIPNRWDALRPIKQKELEATTILRLPIKEYSAKIRQGEPKEDWKDLHWPVWAGVIPLRVEVGEPQPDHGTVTSRSEPPSLESLARRGRMVTTALE